MRSMRDPRNLRGALLAATLGLAQCHDGGGGPQPTVALVDAFPQLTFAAPVFFAQAPGDPQRAFVVTQAGAVHVFDHASAAASSSLFLDLRALVTDAGGELGLLGLAFDPDFADNGYLYVNYNPNFDDSGSNPRRTTISRFQVQSDPDSVDPATETVLLEFEQPFGNHNGGWLGFGPDGRLYIASGDGGSAGDPQGNAQDLDSLLGKILRLAADGSIPADNPFVGAGAAEVWAYGLRNPYRASFDRATGELLAGDVGQGQREEIDLVVAGGNYGWRKFEGTLVHNAGDPDPGNALLPLFEYAHTGGRCSIIGGYAYRGTALPAFIGAYFYADFCTGELWALRRDGAAATSTLVGEVAGNPSSFGEDLAGELYVTSFDGKVYKLVPGD
ncbi:MAG: PQQ-dependent sugar dehydrogenase [Nevskiaceae bacterium]